MSDLTPLDTDNQTPTPDPTALNVDDQMPTSDPTALNVDGEMSVSDPTSLAPDGQILERVDRIVEEIGLIAGGLRAAEISGLLSLIAGARRVFFTAQGRSGLVARAMAMRWMHLGLTSYVAGETTTPAIGEGDLLVCLSAGGRTGITLTHAATARAAGATVAVLTGSPGGPLAGEADLVVLVPARTGVASAQHAGSLFEQSCLIVGDALCGAFQQLHALPDRDLDTRHANLL